MNTARSVARFASCRPLRSLLGNPQLVRSQSCCYFSMANHKAAGAAQNYQKASPLYSVTSKAYSQGPKDGNLEKETSKDRQPDKAKLKSSKQPESPYPDGMNSNQDESKDIQATYNTNQSKGQGQIEKDTKGEELSGMENLFKELQENVINVKDPSLLEEMINKIHYMAINLKDPSLLEELIKTVHYMAINLKDPSLLEEMINKIHYLAINLKAPSLLEELIKTVHYMAINVKDPSLLEEMINKIHYLAINLKAPSLLEELIKTVHQMAINVKSPRLIKDLMKILHYIAINIEDTILVKELIKLLHYMPSNVNDPSLVDQLIKSVLSKFHFTNRKEETKSKRDWRGIFPKPSTAISLSGLLLLLQTSWFYQYHKNEAAKNSRRAHLIVGQDQVDIKRVVSFIGNDSWKINKRFDYFKNKDHFYRPDSKVLYLHGDPGIGKSAAFSALVHNMNHGSQETKKALRKAFPFLDEFNYFFFIHGNSYFGEFLTQAKLLILPFATMSDVLVVIDDIHIMFESTGGKMLYEGLNNSKVKCILLVSSQYPNQEVFKNFEQIQRYNFTELPKEEAILQLQNAIYKKKFHPPIPLSLSRLFAYRLWFYLGGNFRAINKLIGNESVALDYQCKSAGRMAMQEEVRTPKSKDQVVPLKSEIFPEALNFLSQYHNGNIIEDVTNLEFETLLQENKEEGETTKDKEHKQQEELKEDKAESQILKKIRNLERNNILIRKKKFRKGEDIMSISFHSRRVHFAFNRWLAEQFLLHYQGNKDAEARLNFLKRLERVECKHILGFLQMPFLEVLEKERVSKLKAVKNILPSMTEEQKEKTFTNTNGMEPETARAIVELMESQVDLVMFYLQLFQEGRKLQDFRSDNSQLRKIIDDAKMGPAQFYKKYKTQIDSKITYRKKDFEKIKQEMEKNRTAQIVKLKNQQLGNLWEQCLTDFETLGGFKIQGAITREDDLKNWHRDEKKYQDAKKEIEGQLIEQKDVLRNQMLLMCLELMVDLNYKMKWWDQDKIEEGAQKGKADEGAKQ